MPDDSYEDLIHGDEKFCTIAHMEPRLSERALTVKGVSKAYVMTGWRIAYCGGPRRLGDAMRVIQSQAAGRISSIGQTAAAALDGPQIFSVSAPPSTAPGGTLWWTC